MEISPAELSRDSTFHTLFILHSRGAGDLWLQVGEGFPAQRLEPLADRGAAALCRLRVVAEAEDVAARVEQGLDLERELGWIAGQELPPFHGGPDQLSICRTQPPNVRSTASRTGPLREPYSWNTVTQKSPPCSPVSLL